MGPVIFDHVTLPAATRETKRIFQKVRALVRKEADYIKRNWRKLLIKSALLAAVLALEYFIGLSFIQTLIWDQDAAIAAWIALIEPIFSSPKAAKMSAPACGPMPSLVLWFCRLQCPSDWRSTWPQTLLSAVKRLLQDQLAVSLPTLGQVVQEAVLRTG